MTSMSSRAREIGRDAGALLAERIDGRRTERKVVLSEAKLVERIGTPAVFAALRNSLKHFRRGCIVRLPVASGGGWITFR